eukprot:CAMPEP_0177672502 /NCGR_PEP_ID=MMETSP0447-20121125/25380_1 /TAXON_ID=0 /ORGANISM="Stygamoeba regulata, Strain BSH-02190019" /LENGTH=668 /DNA_ID=CAMNT_0019180183 /DNA_START=20 /DNA_END=2026 /DNA_ORIENTATION=+
MSFAVATTDAHGIILSVNNRCCELFHYSRDELIGKNVSILMPSPYKEQHDSYLERYMRTKKPRILGASREVQAVNSAGSIFPIRISVSSVIIGNEQRFVGLMESAPDHTMTVTMDSHGVMQHVAGHPADIVGWEVHELEGRRIETIIPLEHRAAHQSYIEEYEKSGKKNVIGRYRNLNACHRSGESVPICLRVSERLLVDGTHLYTGIITAIEESVNAVLTLGVGGIIEAYNEACCLLLGYSKDELLGKSFLKLLPESSHRSYRHFQFVVTGDIVVSEDEEREMTLKHSDGSVIVARVSLDPYKTSDNEDKVSVHIKRVRKKLKTISSKPEELPSGYVLGMYAIGRSLGSGYFGHVKEAVHRLSGERVAVKTLRKDMLVNVGFQYPPREVTVLRKLDHQNISFLYDIIEEQDKVYLVIEHISGGDLFDYIMTRKYLSETESRVIFRQLLSAVGYMHSVGIVHRDIKLENILFDSDHNLKLIDMGFCNFFKPDSLLHTFCGSPQYAAPELYDTKPYHPAPVDVWSMGVVLFVMVVGLIPFLDVGDAMRGKLRFPASPSISSDVKDLLHKMLRPHPLDRASLAEIANHRWLNTGFSHPPSFKSLTAAVHTQLDEAILTKMESFGFVRDEIIRSVTPNERNQISATYNLLARRKLIVEGMSSEQKSKCFLQ